MYAWFLRLIVRSKYLILFFFQLYSQKLKLKENPVPEKNLFQIEKKVIGFWTFIDVLELVRIDSY